MTVSAPSKIDPDVIVEDMMPLLRKMAYNSWKKLPSQNLFDPEDLVNEAILVIYDKCERFDASRGVPPVAYLARIVNCRFIDISRMIWRRDALTIPSITCESDGGDGYFHLDRVAAGSVCPDVFDLQFSEELSPRAQRYLDAVTSGNYAKSSYWRSLRREVGASLGMSPFVSKCVRDEIMKKVILPA